MALDAKLANELKSFPWKTRNELHYTFNRVPTSDPAMQYVKASLANAFAYFPWNIPDQVKKW